MIKRFITILCLLSVYCTMAQSKSVFVSTTKFVDPAYKNTIIQIHKKIEEALLGLDNIALVDRDMLRIVADEREVQKHESFMDGKIVEQDKATGADWLIKCDLNEVEDKIRITVVDVESSKSLFSEEYKIGRFLLENKRIERPKYFSRFFDEKMEEIVEVLDVGNNLEVQLVEVSKKDGDKAKEVVLLCSNRCNLKRKTKLKVILLEEGASKYVKTKTEIGEVKITYVETDEVYIAEVKKGHKRILKLIELGKNIICSHEY